MPLRPRKEDLDVIVSAELVETDLEDLARCAVAKFFPPRGTLLWYDGYVYCIAYHWTERPPKIYVFELCRAPMPEYKTSYEIKTPSLVTLPIVRAKGMDLEVIKEVLRK